MLMFCIISIAVIMAGVGADPTGNCGNNVQFDASPGAATTCTENEDCDGLSCAISAAGVSYNFHVINCEDPVLVNFTTTYGGTSSSMVFNQSFVDESAGLNFTMYRNASHVFIHVTVSYNGAEYRVIPHTIVSLNASYCMCQSIKSIANADANEAVPLTCTNNTNCTGLDCTSSSLPNYKFETDVKPCTNPPGIDLIIRNTATSNPVYHGFFSNSTNATLPVIGNLHVHIRHRQYSMTVSVELVISGSLYELVPPSQIILDKSNCGKGSNHSNLTTPTPEPHPTTPPINNSNTGSCGNSVQFDYAQQSPFSPSCTENEDCDGLSCAISAAGVSYNFHVINCEDPVLVNLTTTYGGTSSSMVFNQSFVDESAGFNFTMYRNASHVFIHATVSQNGMEYRAIPHTVVSLNASYCMCQSIKSIANADANEAVPLTCTNNTNCTGLDCTSSALPTYKFETDVKPCTNPPGIDLIIRNTATSNPVYHGFFSNSTNASLPVIGNLHVHIRHRQYSMTVSVELVISGSLYELVPPSQIILDKSNCGKGSNHSNPITPTPEPHPTTTPSNVVDPQTCYSLQQVANTYCHTNTQCDSLICNSPSGYWSQIQLIPCDSPPAVHITLHNKTGGVFYDRILTNSTNITIPSPVPQMQVVFAVTIKNDSVSLEVHTTVLGRRLELLPPATIPINKCYCGNDTSTCTPYIKTSTLPVKSTMSTTTILYTLPPIPSPSVTSSSHSPVIYTTPIPSPSTNSSMSIVTSSSSSSPTIKGQSIGILLVEILVPLIVGISIIILLVLVILLVAVRVWRYKRGQGTMYSRLARGVITMDDESNDTL